jgi:hypothetical protein
MYARCLVGRNRREVALRVDARLELLRHVVARVGLVVASLDQQPRLPPLGLARPQADERPFAAQPLAVQPEHQLAALEPLVRIAERLPAAAVPQQDGAGAVIVRRDHAFERAVLDGMVFRAHGQALVLGIETRAARHRPALQHAVELQAEIVVQAPGGVLLDDVTPARLATLRALRLRCLGESALGVIGRERRWRTSLRARFALAGRAPGHPVD